MIFWTGLRGVQGNRQFLGFGNDAVVVLGDDIEGGANIKLRLKTYWGMIDVIA